MFTGLIQAVGKVSLQGSTLRVDFDNSFATLQLGDSIAVDGVCLTIVDIGRSGRCFYADVSEETLSRTTLGTKLKKNGLVNIEPALRFSDRLGGHLVSGHIDGLGSVVSIKQEPNSWIIELKFTNKRYGRYICEKGSICIDGISLTVVDCSDDGNDFSTAVIPHTWSATNLHYLSVGDLVNLEVDLMAKYAEKILMQTKPNESKTSEINDSWLKSQGWV